MDEEYYFQRGDLYVDKRLQLRKFISQDHTGTYSSSVSGVDLVETEHTNELNVINHLIFVA